MYDYNQVKDLRADEERGIIQVWWDDNEQPHREGGPAIMGDGYEYWVCHGTVHRKDGPAFVNAVRGWGTWYVRGLAVLSWDELKQITGCTEADLIMLKLKWKTSLEPGAR